MVNFSAIFVRRKGSGFPMETPFSSTQGSNRGQKVGQSLPFPIKSLLEAEILHTYLILDGKFDFGIYFCHITFWPILGHPTGQVGVKKSQLLISLKVHPRKSKFAQGDNFSWKIWYCPSFRTNYKFWTFLGQPGGQVWVKKIKNC